jgi:hypothetical protein
MVSRQSYHHDDQHSHKYNATHFYNNDGSNLATKLVNIPTSTGVNMLVKIINL